MTATLSPWEVRSPSIAAMLNPPLVSLLLSAAAWNHQRASNVGLPFEYSFLVVPLVLHKGTRRELPANTNSHITKWIAERPVIQAGFPLRAKSLAPFVREGTRHGLRVGQLRLVEGGRLSGSTARTATLNQGSELAELVRSASLVGRWLAKTERPSTTFALFGVTP